MRTKHGDLLRVVWNNNIVLDDDGNPAYVVMTGIDVTAERTAAGLVDHLLRGVDHDGADRHRPPRPDHALQLRRQRPARATTPHEVIGTPFIDLLDPERARRAAPATRPRARAASPRWSRASATHGETPPRDWTWVGSRRHAAHGVDDPERRRGRARGPQRLPLRRPRRHRAAAQPGDADRRAGDGAARRSSGCAGSTRPRTSSCPRSATSCARR